MHSVHRYRLYRHKLHRTMACIDRTLEERNTWLLFVYRLKLYSYTQLLFVYRFRLYKLRLYRLRLHSTMACIDRTLEEVEALLEFSKVDSSSLLPVSQTLEFPDDYDGEKFTLMQLPESLVAVLKKGDRLVFFLSFLLTDLNCLAII